MKHCPDCTLAFESGKHVMGTRNQDGIGCAWCAKLNGEPFVPSTRDNHVAVCIQPEVRAIMRKWGESMNPTTKRGQRELAELRKKYRAALKQCPKCGEYDREPVRTLRFGYMCENCSQYAPGGKA